MICTIYRQGCPITGQLVAAFQSAEGCEVVAITSKPEGLALAASRGAVVI